MYAIASKAGGRTTTRRIRSGLGLRTVLARYIDKPIAANTATNSHTRYIQLRTTRKLQPPNQICEKAAASTTARQSIRYAPDSFCAIEKPAAATSSCSPDRVPVAIQFRQYHHPAVAVAAT